MNTNQTQLICSDLTSFPNQFDIALQDFNEWRAEKLKTIKVIRIVKQNPGSKHLSLSEIIPFKHLEQLEEIEALKTRIAFNELEELLQKPTLTKIICMPGAGPVIDPGLMLQLERLCEQQGSMAKRNGDVRCTLERRSAN